MSKSIKKYREARFVVALLFLTTSALAQVPGGINYQAMALDSAGSPLQNQSIRLRFGVVELNSVNTPIFQETHLTTTDNNGIFALQIGQGSALINTIDSVHWENSPVFLKVEMDKTGGTNYSLIGLTEFFTVPYAFRAAYGADEDADPTNEIQNLSLQGQNLSISGGNTLNLGAGLYQLDVNRTLFADDRDNTGFSIPLDSGTTATNNTLFGGGTGNVSMTGYQNSLFGHRAGQSLSSGYNNTYYGVHSGRLTTAGYGNVAMGVGAGEKNQIGQYNTYVGDQAGKNALGAYNTVVGKSAGYSLTTGSNNVFLGTNAGVYNQTGSGNVFLGMNAGFNAMGSNRLYIDNSNTTSPLLYGEFENDLLRINGDLDVEGNITQNGGPITINPLDNDSTNELQTLSLSGLSLSISEGNSLVLPQEVDGDSTNELQFLSLNGQFLSISEGNSVELPQGNGGVSVDFGAFQWAQIFTNYEKTIYHDLGSVPSLIEVNWFAENDGVPDILEGIGYYNGTKYSSVIFWSQNGYKVSEIDTSSIMSAKQDSNSTKWKVVVQEMTSTYVKFRVSQSNSGTRPVNFSWKVFK